MAEPILSIVNEDDFSAEPPSHEEIEFDHIIKFDISLLNQAARGEHLAWALSGVINSIMRRYGRPNTPRLKPQQREQFLDAITSAHLKADKILPPLCSPSTIYIGIDALVDFVIYHAAGDEQRAAWYSDMYRDMHAYARIRRNVLENASLAEEIGERAEKCRSKMDEEDVHDATYLS